MSYTTVGSHRVAAELRRCRQAAGLSCQDVAERLGMSVDKLARLESGATGLRIADVAALLDLYHAPAAGEVLAVVRQCHRGTWWTRTEPRHWRSLRYLEASAGRIRDYSAYFVPLLLRTADYTRQLPSGDLVAQRARQAAFDRPGGPVLDAIVDDLAVEGLANGDSVARAQLEFLLAATERPNVTLRLVPRPVGVHGPFTIMGCPGDVDVVFTEQLTTAMYFQAGSSVAVYRAARNRLDAAALSVEDTRDRLAALLHA